MPTMLRRTYEKLLSKQPASKHKNIRYGLALTESFYTEMIKVVKELTDINNPFNRGSEIMFYMEENIEDIKDRLYEDITKIFSNNELRHLSNSHINSSNYKLAYNRLKKFYATEYNKVQSNRVLLAEEEILYLIFNILDKKIVAESENQKINEINAKEINNI